MNPGQEHDPIPVLQSDLRILMVDDNRVNLFLGKRILNNLGFTLVTLSDNPSEALQLAGAQLFHVVLTDVEMPGMNGYELCRMLRQQESATLRKTIIAITANASGEDREQAREAGIDAYLTKPYSPQELAELLAEYHPGSPRSETIDPALLPEGGLEQVYAVFNHNMADVRIFLQMLSRHIPELLDEIECSLGEPTDLDKAYQAAHKLKSPVKLLAAPAFASAFSSFAESLRTTDELRALRQAFAELKPGLIALLVLVNTGLESTSS